MLPIITSAKVRINKLVGKVAINLLHHAKSAASAISIIIYVCACKQMDLTVF